MLSPFLLNHFPFIQVREGRNLSREEGKDCHKEKKKKDTYPHAEPSNYSTLVGQARRNKNEKNHPQNANTFKVSILKILLKNHRSQVKSKHISFKTLKIGTVLLCFLECIRWKVAFDQCQPSCLTVLWYVYF